MVIINYIRSPLHYAAYYGSLEICRVLVKNGANVFLQTHEQKLTPYDVSFDLKNNIECEKYLLGDLYIN